MSQLIFELCYSERYLRKHKCYLYLFTEKSKGAAIRHDSNGDMFK